MKENNVVDFAGREAFTDSLTELLRTGARQLLEQAVKAESAELMEQYSGRVTSDGKAAVVRNGCHPERENQTGTLVISVNGQTILVRGKCKNDDRSLRCSSDDKKAVLKIKW